MDAAPKPAPSPLDAMERGDMVAVEKPESITFAGRTWFVQNFAGDRQKAALFVTATLVEEMAVSAAIDAYLAAAINVIVMATDWTKVDPDRAGEQLASTVAHLFADCHRQHMQMLANRKMS